MEQEKSHVEKIIEWMATPADEKNLEVGATLMLQSNRNKILYQNVIRKQNFPKIEYELQKYLDANNVVVEATEETDEEIEMKQAADMLTNIEISETNISTFEKKGLRPDHEILPEEIQNLVGKNAEIYPQMRSLHERLKVLSANGYKAEDRAPFISQLDELQDTLASNWNAYDNYDAKKVNSSKVDPGAPLDSKRVSSNRVFLTRGKTAIVKLTEKGEAQKADKLLIEMQSRFDECISGGVTFSDDQVTELQNIGIIVDAKK